MAHQARLLGGLGPACQTPPSDERGSQMTVEAEQDLSSIDVLSNAAYSEGVPHEQLAMLRRHRPVHFQAIPDQRLFDEAWVLTKHADVLAASKATDVMGNAHGLNLRGDYSDDEDRHLLNLDDPYHLHLRRMTNKGFTPKVVKRYAEHYRNLARQLFDEALATGNSFDVVDKLAVPLPLLAICELLGTTPDNRDQLIAWSNAIISNDDPDYSPSDEHRTQAFTEMGAYSMELLNARLAEPADDLASVLAENLRKAELTEGEYRAYVALLFIAGNETTRNNISHGIAALAQNPEQFALLKTGAYFDSAVEEMIRWSSPVTYMSRTVEQQTDFNGYTFNVGDKVVLHYGSANRDEEVFAEPMRFDITRDPNPHIAFGFGAHFCLGAHLARLETRCLLEELVARADTVNLDGRISYVRSSFINGIKECRIKIA